MSLFSTARCERCGRKIGKPADGKAVCDACESELALLIESRRETVRTCPIDGAPMAKEVVHMIIVDRCTKCRGVWLDGGELEKVYASASDSALTAMAKGLWVH